MIVVQMNYFAGCENLDIKKHFDFIKDEDLMLLIRARKYNVERAFSTVRLHC